jgi:hypothetical protein
VTYKTLMVHLELGRPNAGLLEIAGDLAERFQAGVIGIAACQPFQIAYGDGFVSGDILEEDRAEIDKEIRDAETEFREALQARADTLEWRSAVVLAPLSDYLAREARSADLAITSVDRGSSVFDSSRHAFTSDFVMRVGRPVLIVPPAVGRLKLQRVVVGWKDSRETRRAILDALPLLEKAAHVTVVEIAAGEALASTRLRLDDVIAWLKRHGVVAEARAMNWPQTSSWPEPMAIAVCANGCWAV